MRTEEDRVNNLTSPSVLWRASLIAVLALVPGIAYVLGDANAIACRGIFLEDAFYYLTLARNLAGGDGLTLDGMHPTNGFQPLQLLLMLPGAAFLSEVALVRYAAAIGVLFHVATSVSLYFMCRHLVAHSLAFAVGLAWAWALSARLLHINGLETGLFLLIAVWVSWFYIRIREEPLGLRQAGALGLLLGICFLARVDAIFLGLAIGLDLVWRYRRAALWPLVGIAGAFALAVLPWLIISLFATDAIVPDSGIANRHLALHSGPGWYRHNIPAAILPEEEFTQKPLQWTGINLGFFGVSSFIWSPPFGWIMGFAHAVFFSRWRDKTAIAWLLSDPVWLVLATLFLAVVTIVFAYRLRFGFFANAAILQWVAYAVYPTPPWFSIRYCILCIAIWTIISVGILGRHLARHSRKGVWLVGSLWFLANGMQTHTLYPRPVEPEGYLKEALWLRDNLPRDAVLGSFQSGTMSYFSRRRVVNLDGVVNRYALRAMQRKELGAFLQKAGVTHVADWGGILGVFFWPNLGKEHGLRLHKMESRWFEVWAVDGAVEPPG